MELSHKHQVYLTITIVSVLFTIILLMIGPTIKGINLSKQFSEIGMDVDSIITDLESKKTETKVLNVKLDSCENLNNKYVSQLKSASNETYNCIEEKRELLNEISRLNIEYERNISDIRREIENNLTRKKEEIQKLNENLENLNKEFELLIQNAANNLCCKYKVDFPNTDSYFISNNRIVCANGEETKITC